MITPLPGAIALKPGSATLPFVSSRRWSTGRGARSKVSARAIWSSPTLARPDAHGLWRSQALRRNLFLTYKNCYFTGDGCRRDKDGYYWITGRVDDVLNVSGHRMGTAEIESALVAHPKVSEAAVVGYPHNLKGQGIYCYVTLMAGNQGNEALRKELVDWVRKEIGPIASPGLIQFAPGLPKTRSGKIMRRILRKIAEDDYSTLGDISTLADPTVVEELIINRQNRRAPSEGSSA